MTDNKWKVSHTYAGGEMLYQVYRLRDPFGVDHSGNRDVLGTFDSEEVAQELADEMNCEGIIARYVNE